MATHGHIGWPCSICGFPLEGKAAENFINKRYTDFPKTITPLKTLTSTRTIKPKTVKSYLKSAIMIANTPIADLKGVGNLTQKEQQILSILGVVLQNELGENSELLDKFKLKYH